MRLLRQQGAMFLIVLSGSLALAGSAPASRPAVQTKVIEMTVRPAAEPTPALKYLLLPEFLDRQPGNAALLYYSAFALVPSRDADGAGQDERVADWLAMPLKDLPRKEAADVVAKYADAFATLDAAARREQCDWEVRVRAEGFGTVLPMLSPARRFARILALKARLETLDDKIADAIHTLQTGFAMARHVSQGTLLIGSLVGDVIAAMMANDIPDLVQSPGAPNLYWAVADLPRPIVPIQEAMEMERSILFIHAPELRDAISGKRDLTAEEWQRIFVRVNEVAFGAPQNNDPMDVRSAAIALRVYPEAKQYLIAHGRRREVVEAMPVPQVMAIYSFGEYMKWRDDLFKWFNLPYWQARGPLAKWETDLVKWSQGEGRLNPATTLLPALSRAMFHQAKVDRQIAALQTIEAVRMYAQANDGRLPTTLGQVTEVPLPIDPVTGTFFVYHAAGNTFFLDLPAPKEMTGEPPVQYAVTVQAQ